MNEDRFIKTSMASQDSFGYTKCLVNKDCKIYHAMTNFGHRSPQTKEPNSAMLTAYDLFSLKSQTPQRQPHVVTIGNFDGVHLGHCSLIQSVREEAFKHGLPCAAVTFNPHPQQLLDATRAPAPLTSLTHKLELLAKLELDLALVIPFTPGFATLSPDEFIRSVILAGLDMRHLVVGYDFALGKERKGNFDVLHSMGMKYGFTVKQKDPFQIKGIPVSSSRIRECIHNGFVDEAALLLGRPHCVEGSVVHGFGRGAGLGFPTININYGNTILPAPGVYAVLVELAPSESILPIMGVANIGNNPTFGAQALSLEAHLLDFSQDIYGRSARINFIKRLRGETCFPNVDALIRQIADDISSTRACFASMESTCRHIYKQG